MFTKIKHCFTDCTYYNNLGYERNLCTVIVFCANILLMWHMLLIKQFKIHTLCACQDHRVAHPQGELYGDIRS